MAHSKIVFDHLAKSAGVSARRFFADSLGEGRISHQLGGYVLNHIHLFEQFDVLQGHFYGRVLYKIHPDVKFITVLRHPIERFLSYYSYVRSYPGDHPDKPLAKQLTIDEFVNHKSDSVLFVLFNNATTHFAAAMGDRLPMKRLLSEAKTNLEKYDVIGLTENMSAFFEDCCLTFGWSSPRHNYLENVTQHRIASQTITAETLDIIASYNLLDLELYQFARDLIEYRRGGLNTLPSMIPPDDHDNNVAIDQPAINVDLLEANGQPERTVTLRSGEKLSLRLLLQADRVSDNEITVVFSLRNESPVQLFLSSSQLLGHHIKVNAGDRKIMTLEFLIPLAVGEYFLELCVLQVLSSASGRLIYFRNKEFLSLIVDSPANYRCLGAVNLCPKLGWEDLRSNL